LETVKPVLIAFTNELESRGHSLRLGDLDAMQTGSGRVGVEVATDDADKAADEVRALIEAVPGAKDVLSLTGSSERLGS
jgi:hypothetical protein